MSLVHFQFTFEQFKQREGIGGATGKASDHFVVIQATDFFHVAFHYRVAQCGLAITSDNDMAVTAYAYYCCHEQTPWLQMQNTDPATVCGADCNYKWGRFWGFQPPAARRMQFVWPAIFRRLMVESAFSLPFTGPITTRFQPLLAVMRESNPSNASCARTVSA
ncbi:hypothetical protein AKI40_4851 [Enterobacter sp. FY-07]|nr:hypothetical protein AKI40_4851 [Enterobacter sp. FY-07]